MTDDMYEFEMVELTDEDLPAYPVLDIEEGIPYMKCQCSATCDYKAHPAMWLFIVDAETLLSMIKLAMVAVSHDKDKFLEWAEQSSPETAKKLKVAPTSTIVMTMHKIINVSYFLHSDLRAASSTWIEEGGLTPIKPPSHLMGSSKTIH